MQLTEPRLALDYIALVELIAVVLPAMRSFARFLPGTTSADRFGLAGSKEVQWVAANHHIQHQAAE
jgi:hypothetical protein